MNIKGPHGGPRAPGAVDDVTGPDGPSGPESPESIDSAKSTSNVAPVKGSAPAAISPDAIAQVAGELRSGSIGVDEAVDRLIDDAIDRQIGAATADRSDLKAKLRSVLKGITASDPLLVDKLRRLTLGAAKKT